MTWTEVLMTLGPYLASGVAGVVAVAVSLMQTGAQTVQTSADAAAVEVADDRSKLRLQDLMTDEYQALRAEVRELNTLYRQQIQTVAQQQVTIANGRAEADRLVLDIQNEREKHAAEMKQLTKENEDLRGRVDRLEKQVNDVAQRAEDNAEALRLEQERRAEVEAERDALRTERDSLIKKVAQLEDDLAATRHVAAEQASEIEGLRKQITELADRLKDVDDGLAE